LAPASLLFIYLFILGGKFLHHAHDPKPKILNYYYYYYYYYIFKTTKVFCRSRWLIFLPKICPKMHKNLGFWKTCPFDKICTINAFAFKTICTNISPCKNIIFKKSSKRNQNPSRYYYNSVINSQVSTQAKISSFKNPHIIKILDLLLLLLLPRGQNPSSYYILCNESKKTILALVGKTNKFQKAKEKNKKNKKKKGQ
jgi:hypothetical protein